MDNFSDTRAVLRLLETRIAGRHCGMQITPTQRVASRVRSQIDAAGLTQEAIGSALHMSQSALSRRYLGRVEWRASELAALAKLLDVTVESLIDTSFAKK